MIHRPRGQDAHDDTYVKPGFKRLLLRFMAKELLTQNGAGPPSHRAKRQ